MWPPVLTAAGQAGTDTHPHLRRQNLTLDVIRPLADSPGILIVERQLARLPRKQL